MSKMKTKTKKTKAKKTKTAKKAKAKKTKAPSKGLDGKIKLITSATHRFNKGSLRGKCFDLIKPNMTVGDYLKKASAQKINGAKAKAALDRLKIVGSISIG